MEHDHSEGGNYIKRCYCEKCKRKYDDWCDEHEHEGKTHCKKRCVTHCEYVCSKPIKTVKKWGYKKEFVGKWEKYEEKCHDKKEHHEKKHHEKKECDKHSRSEKSTRINLSVESSD